MSTTNFPTDIELHTDALHRAVYATDASVYRERPLGVCFPRSANDISLVMQWASRYNVPVIPRAAGTSLAGQCVGSGLVMDTSRYMNEVLEINVSEKWVRVQPGVVRDELNRYLKPHGLFFGPNTSTSNRATIGGMVGNNSCGSTSLAYGSTRDHVVELDLVLADGSQVSVKSLNEQQWHQKTQLDTLEGAIYRGLEELLSNPALQQAIRAEYPHPDIHRRNTGYALDLLLPMFPFSPNGTPANLCTLLAGSEGTLAAISGIKLALSPLPLPHEAMVCAHFSSIRECMLAVQTIMTFRPDACEMMDKTILDCTLANPEQRANRYFVEGDPQAILMVSFRDETQEAANGKAQNLISALQTQSLGYAFPVLFSPNTQQAEALRKAGLGLLGNLPGDAKAVACIEDTAIRVADLPGYIEEFTAIMQRYGQQAVYYAHAGDGEIHLRPILNLKTEQGVADFVAISSEVATLVKKYKGSLSGEHGDGRVRAAFIPQVLGSEVYAALLAVKKCWDPLNLLNPGKIVEAAPMDESLRYEKNKPTPAYETIFRFDTEGGILRAAEKCNGSGDCRKSHLEQGGMCPSYQATRDEKDTTRARANALREFLTHPGTANPFEAEELRQVMDLCISCKACARECPSSVDMATLKAEFQYQYYRQHRRPLRDYFFAYHYRINRWALPVGQLSNAFLKARLPAAVLKKLLGIAPARSLPEIESVPRHFGFRDKDTPYVGKNVHPAPYSDADSATTSKPEKKALKATTRNRNISLKAWYTLHEAELQKASRTSVWFWVDELVEHQDALLCAKAILLLHRLGYGVKAVFGLSSGRACMSKGFLEQAKRDAERFVSFFSREKAFPIVGLEPSAVYSVCDEFPRLVEKSAESAARELGARTMLVEHFLAQQAQAGLVTAAQFVDTPLSIALHGHCHQKAHDLTRESAFALSIPRGHTVSLLSGGCCGMAGSFGYEVEHYEVSQKIGELVLYPTVRALPTHALVAAPGTSCRHQIHDGTGKKALHPIAILWDALKNDTTISQ